MPGSAAEYQPERPEVPATRDSVRIGDAERHVVIEDLQVHYRDGRLDLLEFEDRLERAGRARTASDLAVLTADLPALVEGAPAPITFAPDPSSGLTATSRNAVVRFAVLSVFFIALWAVTSGIGSHFWPIYPILGIGMGTAFQVFGVDEDDDE